MVNTLNNIIDDLMLIIRNSNIAESENISRRQVEQWVHTYRTKLLKEDIDKDGDIDPQYVQEINNIHLTIVNGGDTPHGNINYCKLEADIELPKLLDLNHRLGLLSVTDLSGNPIQIGTKVKAKYQKHRKYTCNDYIATLVGNKIYIYGPNIIEYINIEIIPEDPTELDDCADGNDPYPIPGDKIPTLKELILVKEFGYMLPRRSDDTNNTKNELANGVSLAV